MSLNLGRQGWVGIAIESTPGVPVSPTDYVPYLTSTLRGKMVPIADIAARGQREKEFTSVVGKKSGEGDFSVNLDPLFSGYLFKMALGTEGSVQNGATGVYDHTFTVDENTVPTSASLIFNKAALQEIYPYSTIDTLEIDVKDALATMKASVKSQFPATSVSGTNTTTSGIVFAFKDLTVQFGSTLAGAQAAAATKVASLNLKINNNQEAVFRSGNSNVDTYAVRGFEVTGEYDLYLENNSELQNYYSLTKQYAIFTFTGRGIGSGYSELVQITLYNMRLNDVPVETGIDNLFMTKSQFVGEYSVGDSKTAQVLVRNRKSTAY